MPTTHRGLVLAALLASAAAQAQIYPFSVSSQAYVSPSGATPLTFTSQDSGHETVTLPFSFYYFGQTYTSVVVGVNGALTLGSACSASGSACITDSNNELPSATKTPRGVVAGFWDDLLLGTGSQVRTSSSPSEFVVEWYQVQSYYSSTTQLTFLIRLKADGTLQIHHGSKAGTYAMTATIGYEDATGTKGLSLAAKASPAGSICNDVVQTGCCSSTTGACTLAEFVPDALYTFRTTIANGTELAPNGVALSSLAEDAVGNLQLTFGAQVQNLGTVESATCDWRAYTSLDKALSADDQLIATGTVDRVDAGAALALSATGATTTPPDAGYYYLLFEVNPLVLQLDAGPLPDGGTSLLPDGGLPLYRQVTEGTYANNVGVSAAPFARGVDLVADLVSGPTTTTGAGSQELVHVVMHNAGTRGAQSVQYRVYASSDKLFDAADQVAYTGTAALQGGQTLDTTVTAVIPSSLNPAAYYLLLKVDSNDQVAELSETNNVASTTATFTVAKADLVAGAVDATDPVTGASVRTARFGDSLDVTINATNAGTFIARNYQVMVAISSDNALSLLNDTVVIEQAGPDLAPGASQALTFHVVLPMKDRSAKDFTTGNWFIFVQLNSTGAVGEANMVNNALAVGPMKLYAPGPDLIVSTVQAPASAGVGEIVPVYRSLRNVGNVDAVTNYRYFISPNNIITTDDLPLAIVAADGSTTPSGTVTLAKGNAQSASELVRLPAQMQPGTWYIGCYVDPDNTVTELIETNNGTASSSVLVAGSTLKVVTSQVPDAIVGRSYLFRLAASGEIGPSTWALDASQGQLPDGLAMAADGTISGTPSGKEGVLVTAFTAVVTNSGQSTAGRVAMRVLPASSQVEISTAALPAAINSPTVPYQVGLGASGGVRPYTWRVAQGALPAGLTLSGDGVISGAPRAGQADGVTSVTLEVRDATGSTARRALQVRLVSAGALIFKGVAMPDGAIGADYATEVAVENVDGSALAKPLTFRSAGHLPPGITVQPQAEVVLVAGKPTVGGDFVFTLSVEDARGRTDTIELSIHVAAPRLKLSAALPAVVRPGEALNVAFKADPSNGARFELVSGALPPGVGLQADGVVFGTVATEQSEGTWPFVVQATDPAGSSGLGAFALVVERAPVKTGCSATGEGAGPLALLAVGLLALRRRRLEAWFSAAGGGAVAAALVVALIPGLAAAQTGYTLDGPASITFQPLTGGTSLSPSTTLGATVQLPFAFDFFGTPVNTVVMTRYGYLALLGSDDTTTANMTIPHANTSTYYPQSLIAPWWDSLGGGTFKWQATGTAPNRVAVFEWNSVYASTSSTLKMTFQAHLYEGTGQIRFAYGAVSPGPSSASIGVMRDVGVGLGFGSCGAAGTCNTADYPANKSVDFVRPPDFTVKAVVPDTTGYSGVAHRTQVTVGNLGGKSSPATVRLFLSVDTHFDSADATLGEVTLANVPAQGEASGTVTGLVPSAIVPGVYFVLAQVDSDNLVLEQNESNNWYVPQQVTIASPAADLAVTAVSAPGTIAPGAMMTVNRTLQNVGNSAIGSFKYSWFLSNNPAVTIADTALTPVGTVAAGLAPRATDVGTDTLALPANLKAGQYWLGVCVNYDSSGSTVGFMLPEITWLNNCVASRTSTVVSSGTLTVLTTSLPGAAQYAPWGMRLAATGGDGAYTWALANGALPPGMNFTAQGDLSGTPATTGAFSFTVKVTSAGQTQEQALSLQVAAGNLPLVVVDQDLPAAEFGRAYSAALVALGGKPPYTWQVRDGALPVGLALATDGHVEGRAATGTAATFTVEVTDAANTSVSKDLTLRVVNPASLAIANQTLAEGQILHDYLQPLMAVGGTKPYTWSITGFQQVAENATEAPGPAAAELPSALGLVLENAASGSFLRGVPKMAGLYKLGLKVTDSAAVEDSATLLLYVTYRDGLAITTLSLPDAFIGLNYVARLSHNADSNQVEVKFATTCLLEQKREGEYACVEVAATEQLPVGLTLDEKGFLGGGAEGPPGVYSFLVKATDGSGRQDVRAMAIRVLAAPVTSGCTSGGVAPSFLAALALLGGVLRARRAGRRS